jgi:hypothetical protein
MTATIPDTIADECVERLSEILEGNDYEFDVAEVIRPTRKGENWLRKHLGIAVLQGTAERVTALDCPGNPPSICYSLPLEIVGVCRDSSSETDAKAISDNTMAAAIVKAITTPASSWYQFGGVAINAEIGDTEVIPSGDGEFHGVTITIRVIYRVSENDPYTVRM